MKLEKWIELQEEYNVNIFDVKYNEMTIQQGRSFIEALTNKFNDIYNDDSGEEDDDI